MSNFDEAKYVIKTCIWSIKKDVVDLGLAHLLMISLTLVRLCPKEVYEGLRSQWVRLLSAVARGCERQLCSGDEQVIYREILPTGYRAMS